MKRTHSSSPWSCKDIVKSPVDEAPNTHRHPKPSERTYEYYVNKIKTYFMQKNANWWQYRWSQFCNAESPCHADSLWYKYQSMTDDIFQYVISDGLNAAMLPCRGHGWGGNLIGHIQRLR